jgi:hypothetical protein
MGGISSHGPKPGRGEEEKDMFSTDSFLGAEITYRQDRIRKDYGHHRWTRPTRGDHVTTL